MWESTVQLGRKGQKILGKCNFPKLNEKEIENMNRLITNKEIKT